MALRIGKKKDAAPAPTQASVQNAAPVEAIPMAGSPAEAPVEDWSDFSTLGEEPSTPAPIPPAMTRPSIPPPTPAVVPMTTEPADAFVNETFAPVPPPKKKMSPALLAAGLVLLLTAAGVGAYFAFFNAPPEDDSAPLPPPRRVAKAPAPAPPAEGKTPPVMPVTTKTVPVKPKVGAPVKKVAAGKAGIVTPGTTNPGVRPKPGKPAAMVPKPNQPTPVPIMPDGVAGQPGKGLQPGATVPVVRPAAPMTPALFNNLKTLWRQGAAAKRRNDFPAARRAWTKMLQLRPGHPGVQEAIDKLPKLRG